MALGFEMSRPSASELGSVLFYPLLPPVGPMYNPMMSPGARPFRMDEIRAKALNDLVNVLVRQGVDRNMQ